MKALKTFTILCLILLFAVVPTLAMPFDDEVWSYSSEQVTITDESDGMQVVHPEGGDYRVAYLPFIAGEFEISFTASFPADEMSHVYLMFHHPDNGNLLFARIRSFENGNLKFVVQFNDGDAWKVLVPEEPIGDGANYNPCVCQVTVSHAADSNEVRFLIKDAASNIISDQTVTDPKLTEELFLDNTKQDHGLEFSFGNDYTAYNVPGVATLSRINIVNANEKSEPAETPSEASTSTKTPSEASSSTETPSQASTPETGDTTKTIALMAAALVASAAFCGVVSARRKSSR